MIDFHVLLFTMDVRQTVRYWGYRINKPNLAVIWYGIVNPDGSLANGTGRNMSEVAVKKAYHDKLIEGYKELPHGEIVRAMQSIGTSNSRSWDSLATALYYKTDTNGFLKHMLAKYYNSDKHALIGNYLHQPKLNGLRSWLARIPVTIGGNTLFSETVTINAFISRYGEIYYLPHITDHIKLEENVMYDGEIYYHGMQLNDINASVPRLNLANGSVSNSRLDGSRLQFHCYDVSYSNKTFVQRLSKRSEIVDQLPEFIKRVETKVVNENPTDILKRYTDNGYEGSIYRLPESVYYYGHRVEALLKQKFILEGDFVISDIVLSKKGEVKLVLVNDVNESTFEATVKVPKEKSMYYYTNKHNYVGLMATVTFRERSGINKVPFHANAEEL